LRHQEASFSEALEGGFSVVFAGASIAPLVIADDASRFGEEPTALALGQ
jgi:hypothetical protein